MTLTPQASVYRPSVRTLLLVRFDPNARDKPDFLAHDVFSSETPKQSVIERARAKLSRGKTKQRGPRFVQSTAEAQTAAAATFAMYRDALFSPGADIPALARQVVARDDLSLFLDVQPISSARSEGGYRTANELSLKLTWKTLPIDSRAIRAVLMLHYEGCVGPGAFESGYPGTSVDDSSRTGYLVPATRPNLRFMGFADDIEDEHDENGDIISIKGRSLMGLLIDSKVPRTVVRRIRAGGNVLEAIRLVLDSHPAGLIIRGPVLQKGSDLVAIGEGDIPRCWVPPVYSKQQSDAQKQQTSNVPGAGNSPPAKADSESLWDVITDLCVYNGLHPRIENDQLVVFEPRTLFKGSPTDIETGKDVPVRRLVYGSNVAKMKFARKFGRIRAPTVVVKSSNPDATVASKRLLVARWPPPKKAGDPKLVATNVDATGAIAVQEEHVMTVRGVTSEKLLTQIARTAYDAIAHQELQVAIETRDLQSFREDGVPPEQDPDMLSIKGGDPIQIIVAAKRSSLSQENGGIDVFSMADVNAMVGGAGQQDAVGLLVAQGFQVEVAEQLVRQLARCRPAKEYRVMKASFTFDGDAGFAVKIDARDYVTVRADVDSGDVL